MGGDNKNRIVKQQHTTYRIPQGSCNTGRSRHYITSTPKSEHFLKKQRKSPKNERDSCMPGAKNGERPYLAVPETPFLGSFFACFYRYFSSFHTIQPSQTYIFIFFFIIVLTKYLTNTR